MIQEQNRHISAHRVCVSKEQRNQMNPAAHVAARRQTAYQIFVWAAFAALIAFAWTASARASTPIPGNWHVHSTGDQFRSGTLHLHRQGTTIVGNYEAEKGTTQMTGKLVNDKLSGTWRDPSGESGWLTLNFSETGTGFQGEWGYHGRPSNGNLVGQLIR
jgi:hypothetical protein